MIKAVAVVPSYEPDEKLSIVVHGLLDKGLPVVVVNDGSNDSFTHYFDEVAALPGCTLLIHEVNKGKGRAMKTAFEWIYYNMPECLCAVTVDGDNQHDPDDVINCLNEFEKNGADKMLIGVRDFSLPQVPARSKFGNRTTSFVFRTFYGMKIQDTQTGLRVYPREQLLKMLEVEGNRYEFESLVFLYIKENNLPLLQVPIKTVYIDENQTSHFNAVKDAWRIYSLLFGHSLKRFVGFIKHCVNSLLSALIDCGMYALLMLVLVHFSDMSAKAMMLTATIIARLCSATFNYLMGKNKVFRVRGHYASTAVKFVILSVSLLFLSYFGVSRVTELLKAHSLLSAAFKPAVDFVLFFVSYFAQKYWVFRKSGKEGEND